MLKAGREHVNLVLLGDNYKQLGVIFLLLILYIIIVMYCPYTY